MIRLSEYLPSLKFASRAELDGYLERTDKNMVVRYPLKDEHVQWFIHDGDLLIPHDIYNDISLVVNGNLIIHGAYDDYVASQIGTIACYGNMWAEHIFSWGGIYIDKDLFVDGLIHTVYNDFFFEVKGGITARALLIDDKSSVYESLDVDVFVDTHTHYDDERDKAIRKCKKVFPPLIWYGGIELPDDDSDEEMPDFDRMRCHYYRGENLFLKPRSQKKSGSAKEKLCRVVSMKTSDTKQLMSLASNKDYRFLIGCHPGCPQELLDECSKDADSRIRWAAASNPGTASATLASLALDDSEHVRAAVALNPSTSNETIDKLAQHPSESIKQALADRRAEKTPLAIPFPSFEDYRQQDEELRQRWAQPEKQPSFADVEPVIESGTETERKALAGAAIKSEGLFYDHHDIRDQVLERLMLDKTSPSVREIASCAWLKQSFYEEHEQELVGDNVKDIRFVFALRTRSAPALQQLTQDASFEVRCAVLMNPNAPPEAFEWAAEALDSIQHSKDDKEEIIGALTQNVRLPSEIIALLYEKQPNEWLAKHENAPPEVVRDYAKQQVATSKPELAQKLAKSTTPTEIFALLAESKVEILEKVAALNRHTPHSVLGPIYEKCAKEYAGLRYALAINPGLPPKIFQKLSTGDTITRRKIAGNPSCPIDILRKFSRSDEMFEVRQAANLTLQKLYGEDSN